MKIAVAYFGLPRCTEKSLPTIKKNILENLPKGADVKSFYHFYDQDKVVNPRSNENGDLDKSNYTPFLNFEGILEKPEDVLTILPLNEIKKFGDAWNDDFKSTRNLLLQLWSLKKVTALAKNFKPDIVVFIRPDLVYHDPIKTEYFKLANAVSNSAIVYEWQWGIGINDIFAICGKYAFESYGNRLDEALPYCQKKNSFIHSERLLMYVLRKNNTHIYTLSEKASRVRINGELASEKYSTNISLFSPLTNKYKRFLFYRKLATFFRIKFIKNN